VLEIEEFLDSSDNVGFSVVEFSEDKSVIVVSCCCCCEDKEPNS
jgi:hypothetical protein